MSAKVVTGVNTRWSYAHVWEPYGINGAEPKYSVSLLIPKSDTKTVQAIKNAIATAYTDGVDKLKGSGKTAPAIEAIKTPLRDGDVERPGDEAYAGMYFVNANSKDKPGIVDSSVNPILNQEEVYSGCYGRASISFYAYNANGNRGIACGLGNLQKIKDGARLGGKSLATEDFTVYGESPEDDFLS